MKEKKDKVIPEKIIEANPEEAAKFFEERITKLMDRYESVLKRLSDT